MPCFAVQIFFMISCIYQYRHNRKIHFLFNSLEFAESATRQTLVADSGKYSFLDVVLVLLGALVFCGRFTRVRE